MGETRDRGIPATPDGIAKLKNAKNTGKDDNGKPWTFPSIAEKADIQSHKTVGRFFNGEGIDKGNAYAICQALNLDINEIVDRHEWSPPSPPATQIDWRETCRAAAQAKRQAANTFFANDLGRKIDLNEIHVPLGLIERQQKPQRRDDFSPQAGSQAYQEAEKLIPLSYDEFCEKVLTNSDSPKSKGKRLAVIGEPGAGKTTQLLKICDRILAETEYLPVWISLAEVKKPLCQYLIEDWLRIAAGKLDAAPAEWVKEFQELLSEGKIWLLLDGADEMGIADSLGTLSPQLRERVFDKVRIVISCRLNIWEATGNALSDFDTYRMLDFSYGDGDNCDQVKLFIDQWFRSPPAPLKKGGAGEVYTIENEQNSVTSLTPPLLKGGLGGDLRAALDEPGKERIKDLARNPLRLFLLCLTWEFGQQKLPDTKAELYEVFVTALYDFKKQAFPTTAAQRRDLNTALGRFALKAIEAGYKSILPDLFVSQHLAKPHPELFEKAIDLGWLNRVGVDAKNPLKSVYAFYHPSFQEYFAACEIEDWHFFLNHVPQNPQQGIYRIFERQWKEVMLLWMGRKDVDRGEKEAFIKALVEFDDGCQYFYRFRAYFLAGVLIDEFKDCSLADAIVTTIVKFALKYFNIKKQESERLPSQISQGAKIVLPEIPRTKAIAALTELIRTSDDESTRREALEQLWKIGKDNSDGITALTDLIRTPGDESVRWQAAYILAKIDKDNPDAIPALTDFIRTSGDESVRLQAAYSLEEIDKGNPDAIAALTQLIRTSGDEFIKWQSAYILGKTDKGNQDAIGDAIACLTQLIRTSEHKYLLREAAYSLGKIDKSNLNTIAYLSELIRTSGDESVRLQAAEILGEIDKKNVDAIACLIGLIRTSSEEDIRGQSAEILGEIAKDNPDAIAALTELICTSGDESVRLQAAYSLAKIGKSNPDAIAALTELIRTSEDEDIRWPALETLGEIGKNNPYSIAYLTELIRTSGEESIRSLAAYILGKIGEGNPDAIDALTELIRTSDDESIRLRSAQRLGEIDKGNPDATAALTELIRTSENESLRGAAAYSLGEIDKNNPDAIATLTQLICTGRDPSFRMRAPESSGEIDKGNPDVFPALTDLNRPSREQFIRREAVTILIRTLTETQQMTGVVTALKHCLSDKTYKNYLRRGHKSYTVIWHCAQNLPYPTFYDAWHHPPTTPHPEVPDTTAVGFTSTTSTLNWQTFPQDIAREINNQAELSNQIQLLCIDSKNFINPDNPATKIYTEMLKQGCPKSEDATKTMADLQTYWDLRLMESEKSFILVFYNSRGEEATGFSEIFVNDLSKFDGNIAIVSENKADSLKAFSPSQSDLIGAIVRWICQVVWES
ncbi:HEAT repeat domain-containing protein [Microcoleus sp. A006_D1]|uniref:HEAT repeat domain-containing protein n=1 Tax=Microcoleus sp. A006_D1 TaxID=3055267 RepID=UPI002FD65EE4